MFLAKHGASRRFTFDVIYSALQKSLRSNNLPLALEMAYEFKEYPNALKKRLIQNCTEDIPNLNLIHAIYNTPSQLDKLMPFIPIICNHVKCRDGLWLTRLAAEQPPLFGKPLLCKDMLTKQNIDSIVKQHTDNDNAIVKQHDDLPTLTRKLFTHLCQNDVVSFIQAFVPILGSKYKLIQMYNFISKSITFPYMLCAWVSYPWLDQPFQLPTDFNYIDDKRWDMSLKLPNYVYDKHVRSSPLANKTYSFFINNMILNPRYAPESDFEIQAKQIYIKTNKGVMSMVHYISSDDIVNNNTLATDSNIYTDMPSTIQSLTSLSPIQIQLITSKHKPQTYFIKPPTYPYILKGPIFSIQAIESNIHSGMIKSLFFDDDRYLVKPITYHNQTYILSTNFITASGIKFKSTTTRSSSKLEQDVEIYSGDKYLFKSIDVLQSNNDLAQQMLLILLVRKLLGTNDTNYRNILHIKDRLYTIDDPCLYKQTPYMFKTKLNDKNKQIYEQLQDDNWDYITCVLDEWEQQIYNTTLDIPSKLKQFVIDMIAYMSDGNNWIW